MDVREPRPGEIIGHNYIIESELGRGGFGVVFKARHLDIDRVVALKVLLATYARKDPMSVERFRREATIAASLDYPNTVRVFDYGETEEGVFYLIMEFIQGKDLTHVIAREGRLGVRRAVHIVRQVLHAMMEAHSRGIVHRDIKPDNVMLVPLGYDPDFVKVMDFGIAKMVHGGESLTQAGITLGTPRYMPIEQLKGKDLTPATDLYAVGLVLYEMLIGEAAFSGDTAVDVAVSVMERPSLTVPASKAIPAAVAAIIEKACSKEPSLRFQSSREFLNALNQLDPALLDIDPAEERLDVRLDPPGLRAANEAVESGGGRKTTMLPELDRPVPEGGDIEDATRTIALRTREESPVPTPVATPVVRPTAGAESFHGAETRAMPVLTRIARPAAMATETEAVEILPDARPSAVAGPQEGPESLEEVASAIAEAVARRPSAIYLLLHVLTVVLLLVILLKVAF